MTGHWIFWKAHFVGLTCRSFWWSALNISSNTSFSDGPVCLLILTDCGELNMPLIFMCAVKTSSTYIPLWEIAKINAGWHVLNEEINRNIYFSVHRSQCLRGWEQIGSNNIVFQAGIDCLYEGQWCRIFFLLSYERDLCKNTIKGKLYLKCSFFMTVLGFDVSKLILFGVIICRNTEY